MPRWCRIVLRRRFRVGVDVQNADVRRAVGRTVAGRAMACTSVLPRRVGPFCPSATTSAGNSAAVAGFFRRPIPRLPIRPVCIIARCESAFGTGWAATANPALTSRGAEPGVASGDGTSAYCPGRTPGPDERRQRELARAFVRVRPRALRCLPRSMLPAIARRVHRVGCGEPYPGAGHRRHAGSRAPDAIPPCVRRRS